jgi:glycosyltransferase involved in cell wall biosynthesis
MFTLSVCMIVKDEEPVLARCLACARRFADEIIVVDTGSVDRTKEIAAGFTDRVYEYAWRDDFAAARNYSYSLANCDYIMWLDADDVVEAQPALPVLLPPDAVLYFAPGVRRGGLPCVARTHPARGRRNDQCKRRRRRTAFIS